MTLSACIVCLVAYSVLGWVYESTYCTIKEGRWENRGFLYGPLCPIYGVGVLLMILAWQKVVQSGLAPEPWQVFLVAALGSAVLECATSWVLEKLFHARWWDYRDMPLNLNGRICLPATTLFGLAGLLVAYVLYEPTVGYLTSISQLVLQVLSLIFTSLISADTTLTVSALTRFSKIAASINDSVNGHMEAFVQDARARGMSAAETMSAERERFAESVRASRLGEMGTSVRSAARRVRTFIPEQTPELPDSLPSSFEELTRLVEEIRKRN